MSLNTLAAAKHRNIWLSVLLPFFLLTSMSDNSTLPDGHGIISVFLVECVLTSS